LRSKRRSLDQLLAALETAPVPLEELRAKARQIEVAEERFICEAEARGWEILRRADASPDVVLTTTAEAEAA
jgi:hypothetical protein